MNPVIERMAWAMCADEGTNPDAPFWPGSPPVVPGGFTVTGEPRPMWTRHVRGIYAALRELQTLDGETISAALLLDQASGYEVAETTFRRIIEGVLR